MESKLNTNKIILANWKAYLSPEKISQWIEGFSSEYTPLAGIEVVLAVPSISLEPLAKMTRDMDNVRLAAQDVSSFPQGSYTGTVPAEWLRGYAEFVVVGHRERRKYFRETVQDVANKVNEAVQAGITPIICCDRELFSRQAAAIDSADLDHIVCAYTPDDAESLELARNPQEIADVAELFVQKLNRCPVLYGGGVNAKNIGEIIRLPQLAGVLVGSASLDPHTFVTLLKSGADAIGSPG